MEVIWTNGENQMPASSMVENTIFETPKKFLIKSLNLNCLKSLTTFSNLKTQTLATDTAKHI